MLLHPQPGYTVPAETGFVARAIFPKGNLCITMADRLSYFLSDPGQTHLNFMLVGGATQQLH